MAAISNECVFCGLVTCVGECIELTNDELEELMDFDNHPPVDKDTKGGN